MSYLYRCTNKRKCGKRMALKRLIETYVRPPKCKCCGGNLKRDNAQEKRNKEARCNCDGYHFPHRKGSQWCEHYQGERTDEYWEQFYSREVA